MRSRLSQAQSVVDFGKRGLNLVFRNIVDGVRVSHWFVQAFQPWGVVLAFLSLLATVIAFVVESEDRQSERIFRAWDVVLEATRNTSSQVTFGGNNVRRHAAGLSRGLEYLNRNFQGRWCNGFVNIVSIYVTGNDQRRCVFPKKPRELLVGLSFKAKSLQGIRLSGAQLAFTDFSDSFLVGADLSGARLLSSNFSGALIVGTDFSGAYFQNSNLSKAKIGCTEESGIRKCTDFRGAKNLNCTQLMKAVDWHQSYRDDTLSCGKSVLT